MRRVEHHVAVEAAQLLGGEVQVELRVVHPLALGRQQLDQVGSAVSLGRAEDLGQVGAEASDVGRRCLCSLTSRSFALASPTGSPPSRSDPVEQRSAGVVRRL